MSWTIYQGDWVEVLRVTQRESVHCVVTSPPYWGLRDYGVPGQLGLERTPDEYVAKMVEGFREVRRVLRKDGTLWLNLGDSYANTGNTNTANVGGFTGQRIREGKKGIMDSRPRSIPNGLKQKDLCGIPWMVAFALRADGWYLRSDIIWAKPNPMPESVTDRPTKAHEYLFLMSKSERYYYDAEAIKERAVEGLDLGILRSKKAADGQGPTDRDSIDKRLAAGVDIRSGNPSGMRNKRSVWMVTTAPFSEAHFATFPPKLVEPCILAGCPQDGTVLDPFNGAGTTGLVATRLGRNYIGIELNPEYVHMAKNRIYQDAPLLNGSEMM